MSDFYAAGMSPVNMSIGGATTTDDLRPVGSLSFAGRAAPAAPASGNAKLYADTSGNLCVKRGDGIAAAIGPRARVIVVGDGGDFATIGDAMTEAANRTPSAASPVVVFILPGTYSEQVTAASHVHLIGADREGCIVTQSGIAVKFPTGADTENVTIANLTLRSTGATGSGNALYVYSNSHQISRLVVDNCRIESTDATGIDAVIYNTSNTGVKNVFRNCILTGGRDAFTVLGGGNVRVENCHIEVSENSVRCVYLTGASAQLIELVGNSIRATGTSTAGIGLIGPAPSNLVFGGNVFSGTSADVSGAGTYAGRLHANALNVNSVETGGTERISSTGAGAFAGLANTETVWQDFAAVAHAGGNVGGYGLIEIGANPYFTVGWQVDATTGATYLLTSASAVSAYCPVPFPPGTILAGIRVKWQAVGDGDGVKFRLVKRDESGTATALTLVGAQQTATDPGTPFPVTVTTYTLASPETLAANTSYQLEVESVVPTSEARFYAFGYQTTKRPV